MRPAFGVILLFLSFPTLVSCAVLGLAPALVHVPPPTRTILRGTIRTTEVGSGATTVGTEGRTTTAAETVGIIHVVITRTGEEADMATRLIGRVVEEAGMIATMTSTIIHTAPGGGAPALAHQGNAQAAALAPTTLTDRHRGDLDPPGTPATPLAPDPHPHAIEVARASMLRMLRKKYQKAK